MVMTELLTSNVFFMVLVESSQMVILNLFVKELFFSLILVSFQLN